MTRRRCLVFLSAAALAAGAAPAQEPAPGPVAAATPRDPLHAAFDRILEAHVRGERVDYRGIRARHRDDLRRYLDALAEVDLDRLPRDAQLAYCLNLYNATMIATIVDRYEAGWTAARGDFAVFKQKLVRMKGKTISLDELEHEIVRKRFRDHRVHVALVCGARSCPPLQPRAWDAARLDQELDQAWRAFLQDPVRNRIDRDAKVVRLSRIFQWFAEDFGGEKGIRKLLAAQLGDEVAAWRIEHLDYSWELNEVPPKDDR